MKIELSYSLLFIIFLPNIYGLHKNCEKEDCDKYKEVNNLGEKSIKFMETLEEIVAKSDIFVGFKEPQKLLIFSELEKLKVHFKALEKYEKNEALQDWFHSMQNLCEYFFESSVVYIIGSQKNVREKVEEICRLSKYADLDAKEVIKNKFETAFKELLIRVAKAFGLSETVLRNYDIRGSKGHSEDKVKNLQSGTTSEEPAVQSKGETQSERMEDINDSTENMSIQSHTEVKTSSNNGTKEDTRHTETNEDAFYTNDESGIKFEYVKVSVPGEKSGEDMLLTLNSTKDDSLMMHNITYQEVSIVKNLTNEDSLAILITDENSSLTQFDENRDESMAKNDNEENIVNEVQETLLPSEAEIEDLEMFGETQENEFLNESEIELSTLQKL